MRRFFGAVGLVLVLSFTTPQLSNANQPRLEISETQPREQLPSPAASGTELRKLDEYHYALGGVDASPDAIASDAGVDANARPPPPLDDATCQTGSSSGAGLVAFLFATGLAFRRRQPE